MQKKFSFLLLLLAFCILLGCISAAALTYRTEAIDANASGDIDLADALVRLHDILNNKSKAPLRTVLQFLKLSIGGGEMTDNWTALRKRANTDGIKVLFVGDSLTYYNDMSEIFEAMAKAAGKKIRVEAITKGGYGIVTFQANAMLWASVLETLDAEQWDIVVMQTNRNHTVMGEYFPAHPWDEMQAARRFAEIIDDHGAIPMLYSTFGVTKGSVTRDGYTKVMDRKMHTDLVTAYNATVAERIGYTAVFTGATFNKIYEAEEPINLYHTDNSHPSYAGSYLVAADFYTVIFGESPVNIDYTGELDTETAAKLRTTAAMLLEYTPTEKADVSKPAPAPTISFDNDKLTVVSDSEFTYAYTSGDGIQNAYPSVNGVLFDGDTWSFSTDVTFTDYPGTGNPSGGFRLVQSDGNALRLYLRTAKANITDGDPSTAKYHIRVDAGGSSSAVDLGEFDESVRLQLNVTPEAITLYADGSLFVTITESGATFYEGTTSAKIAYTGDSVQLGLVFCYADVAYTNVDWSFHTGLSFGAHGYKNIAASGGGDKLEIVSGTELAYTYTSGDGILTAYAYANGDPMLGDTMNFSFDVEFTGYPGTGNPSAGFRLLGENGSVLRLYARTVKANITASDPSTAKYHIRVDTGSASTAVDLGEFEHKMHMQLEIKPDTIQLYIDRELFVTVTESGATFYDGTVSKEITYTAETVHLALAFCYADVSFTNVAYGMN